MEPAERLFGSSSSFVNQSNPLALMLLRIQPMRRRSGLDLIRHDAILVSKVWNLQQAERDSDHYQAYDLLRQYDKGPKRTGFLCAFGKVKAACHRVGRSVSCF